MVYEVILLCATHTHTLPFKQKCCSSCSFIEVSGNFVPEVDVLFPSPSSLHLSFSFCLGLFCVVFTFFPGSQPVLLPSSLFLCSEGPKDIDSFGACNDSFFLFRHVKVLSFSVQLLEYKFSLIAFKQFFDYFDKERNFSDPSFRCRLRSCWSGQFHTYRLPDHPYRLCILRSQVREENPFTHVFNIDALESVY